MVVEYLFILVLPSAAFAGGAYLAYRGFRRLSVNHAGISGAVKCRESMQSRLTNERCVYSKVVVERYQGGHMPWKEIFVSEKRMPFLLEGKTIDPAHADIRLSKPTTFSGYVRRKKGVLEQTVDFLGKPFHSIPSVSVMRGTFDLTQEVGENEFLEGQVYAAVMALPGAPQKLEPHLKQPLRVSEYAIKEGAKITVAPDPAAPAGDGTAMRGTLEFPIVITDAEDAAGLPMREKAYLSLFLGLLLVCVSVFLLFFLLSLL